MFSSCPQTMWAHSHPGSPVMIVQVYTHSSFAGSLQPSTARRKRTNYRPSSESSTESLRLEPRLPDRNGRANRIWCRDIASKSSARFFSCDTQRSVRGKRGLEPNMLTFGCFWDRQRQPPELLRRHFSPKEKIEKQPWEFAARGASISSMPSLHDNNGIPTITQVFQMS